MTDEKRLYGDTTPETFSPEEKQTILSSSMGAGNDYIKKVGEGITTEVPERKIGMSTPISSATPKITPPPVVTPPKFEEWETSTPPITMSLDDFEEKITGLSQSLLQEPTPATLPEVNKGLSIFMLTMDAMTGKGNWLDFLIRQRPIAEQKLKARNDMEMGIFKKNAPRRIAQIQEQIKNVSKQYYTGLNQQKKYQLGLKLAEYKSLEKVLKLKTARQNLEIEAEQYKTGGKAELYPGDALQITKKISSLNQLIGWEEEKIKGKRYAVALIENPTTSSYNGDSTEISTDTILNDMGIEDEE